MVNIIKVKMADLNVATRPDLLQTSGLGSCVGLCLYDPVCQVAGMAHIMLPSSTMSKQTDINEAKYADTALPLLIKKMEALGGRRSRCTAKLAGGAHMFSFQTSQQAMRIGQRNVEACKEQLKQVKIPIVADETGGKWGRTIQFFAETGKLRIKTVNQGTKEV